MIAVLQWIRRELLARRGVAGAERGDDAAAPGRTALRAAQRRVADATLAYLASQHVDVGALRIDHDEATDGYLVSGRVADAATRERVLGCCRRVLGAERVRDAVLVADAMPASGAAPVVDPYA